MSENRQKSRTYGIGATNFWFCTMQQNGATFRSNSLYKVRPHYRLRGLAGDGQPASSDCTGVCRSQGKRESPSVMGQVTLGFSSQPSQPTMARRDSKFQSVTLRESDVSDLKSIAENEFGTEDVSVRAVVRRLISGYENDD